MANAFIELTPEKLQTSQGILELNNMLRKLFDCLAGDGESLKVYYGFGVPTIKASNGSIYLRKDGSTVLEIQHYCETTIADYGFGAAGNFGSEVYTVAEFWRVN